MVWWIFKKRDDKKIEEKLNTLDSSLHSSFTNIKKDINSINTKISDMKLDYQGQDLKIEELETKLDLIFNILEQNDLRSEKKEIKETIVEKKEVETVQEPKPDFLKPLTDTQKLIFIRLNTLQKENKGNQIAIKHLAQELYPNKSYDAVRSTLSEYLGILIDLGLVDKSRKGKQTYVYITDKGLKNLENVKEKKLKNIAKLE